MSAYCLTRPEVHKLFSSVMGGESVWRELMRLEGKSVDLNDAHDSFLVDRVAELFLGLWQEDWKSRHWDTKSGQEQIVKLIKKHPDFLYVCKEDFYNPLDYNNGDVSMETNQPKAVICGIAEYLGMSDWKNACIRHNNFDGALSPEFIDLLEVKTPTWLELATQTKESLREDIRRHYTGDPTNPSEMIANLVRHRLKGPIYQFRKTLSEETKVKKSQQKQQDLKAEKEKINDAWAGLLPAEIVSAPVRHPKQPKKISSKPSLTKAAHPRAAAPSLSDLHEPEAETQLGQDTSPEL